MFTGTPLGQAIHAFAATYNTHTGTDISTWESVAQDLYAAFERIWLLDPLVAAVYYPELIKWIDFQRGLTRRSDPMWVRSLAK